MRNRFGVETRSRAAARMHTAIVPSGAVSEGERFTEPDRIDVVSVSAPTPQIQPQASRQRSPASRSVSPDQSPRRYPSKPTSIASLLSDLQQSLQMQSGVPLETAPAGHLENVQELSTRLPGRTLAKFPEPMHYFGEPEHLDAHLLQVRRFLRAYGVDLASDQSVDIACMYLRGKALDWFVSREQLMAKGQAPLLGTFAQYTEALQAAVRPVELTDTYFEPFFNMKQGKRTMRDFVALFNAARAKAPECMSEAMFMYTFKRGCRDDLRRAITVQRPSTLAEMFTLAVAVSDLHNSGGTSYGGGQKGSTPPSQPAQDKPAKEIKPPCTHCGKMGHTLERCWALHPELRKGKSKNAS